MSQQELEVTDVILVLHTGPGHDLAGQLQELKAAGVKIGDVDAENAVVEGTVDSSKLLSLSKLTCVKYIRKVFTYMAET